MELPKLEFLREKNIYSGSQGDFRYKLKPDGEQIHVWAYRTYALDYCIAQGLVRGEADFALSNEGLEQLRVWLGEQSLAL